MQRHEWAQRTDPETVKRRAAGRNRYNYAKRIRALHRRNREVPETFLALGLTFGERGAQAKVAQALGVSRSTICRDMKELRGAATMQRRCPLCQTLVC